MIAHELRRDTGILIVSPQGPLEKSDFEMLAREVDPYIEEKGGLRGLMIQAKSFPGWHDFAALVSHFNFVKDHHQRIAKVAAVTDSGFLAILPSIAKHFVQAEVRHFDYGDKEKALKWLSSAN
ncbi:MAG TPA: STAS/SEC14 domain-containing protein [Sulfuricaulis sp.]|nr:STAS/SEC14 domain-containing protein [Sulfuricaulis sp.]